MISNGFFDFWRRKEFRKGKLTRQSVGFSSDQQKDAENMLNSLNLKQLQSAFYFFLIGALASSLLLIIELMFSKKKTTTKSTLYYDSNAVELSQSSSPSPTDNNFRNALYVGSYYYATFNRIKHD